ncbi:hypothetical protein JRQ81_008575 [Phrynocephalus forsythii]|uniref:E3 ubiquitin-protein ligase RNF182 n=1 Tax=Phrynocephalus forsythii TaxID=171643 RepID=A0A9Q0XAC2_9SAUR|nr:hypothetical protein JRQ81_008575 [Phrynocephalus forsythii]
MAAAGPEPEETAVGVLEPVCPSGFFKPGTGPATEPSRGTTPVLEARGETGDGAEGCAAGTVPTAGFPGRGDVQAEDGPPAGVGEEPDHGGATQGEDTDVACGGAGSSYAEAECLLPQGREESAEGLAPAGRPEESWRTETGPDAPVGKDNGQREYVCLLEEEEEEEDQGLVQEKHKATAQSCRLQVEDCEEELECPICTELYDLEGHRPALLNCSHALCAHCLRAILEASSAADIGRVCCPLCRQKTPMVEWEICRLQEELMLLSGAPDPASVGPPLAAFSPLPARRPGFWGGVEHRFQVRFRTTRMVGFLPCLRYPPGLIGGLARLERRCPAGYHLALLGLLAAEMLSLSLVFLPIALLLLLFLVLDR